MQKRAWTSDNTDLALYITKVSYENNEYLKVKGMLYNKRNNIVYETKNYKLYKKRIKHWYPIES